ncbi:MAG: glycosyltransferase, partial [Patescibacteria group bacterium]|nr:glycosyltransferase [Patescibacteria group bacterium]
MNDNNQEKISLVIPAYNEAENLPFLCEEIKIVMKNITIDYEIIIINDGSSDETQKSIEKLFQENKKHIKGIQFRSNFGKASALKAGFIQSLGK